MRPLISSSRSPSTWTSEPISSHCTGADAPGSTASFVIRARTAISMRPPSSSFTWT
jgi:hypothetical protein